MPSSPIEAACTLTHKEVIAGLTPKDEFLFSTSEFVAPNTKATYVKNKGVYLLFKMPEITTTLMAEMGIWFYITCFNLKANLKFQGQIYKVFSQNETTYPCIIVKIPAEIQAEPADFDETIMNCDISLIWRKTGSMKQGTITQLTPEKGTFTTSTLSITADTHINLTFSIKGLEFQDAEAVVDKVERAENEDGKTISIVEFTFENQPERMRDSLISAIKDMD